MNKKYFIPIIALLMIAVSPSVFGATPVYQGGFTLSDSVISGSYINDSREGSQFALWDDYIAIESGYNIDLTNGEFLIEIYNWRTGNLIYDTIRPDFTNCFYPLGFIGFDSVQYKDGNLFLGKAVTCNGVFPSITILDVSNLGFISQRLSTYFSHYYNKPLLIYESNGYEADFLFYGRNLRINSTDGLETLDFINIIYGEPYPMFVDRDNGYFLDDNGLDIYSYASGELSDETLVGSLEPNTGTIIDWNRNEVNPEYVSSQGNLLLVGGTDYNNFRTSSADLSFSPLFFFERSNIIGVVNNTFWSADMSDLGNIIETDTGITVNADVVVRKDSNKIITYNTTTKEYRVYEVPQPTFSIESLEGVNTPPVPIVSFLGLDGSNNFVFLTSISDSEGGLVFYDLTTTALTGGLLPGLFTDTLYFNTVSDLEKVSSPPGDTCNYFKQTSTPYNWLRYIPIEGLASDPDCDANTEYLSIDIQDVNAIDSNEVSITSNFAVDNYSPFDNGTTTFSYSLLDGVGNYLFLLRYEDDNVAEKYNISYYNGVNYTPLVVNANKIYDLYPNDAFSVIADIDFVNQTINLNLQNSLPNIDLATIPFLEPVSSVGEVRFFEERTDDRILYVESVRYQYNITPIVPGADYELYGSLSPGQTLFDAKAIPSDSFGTYRAWLYATDEDLGLNNIDYWDEITFTYDSSTPILNDAQISGLISEFQTIADVNLNNGFSSPTFKDGDLITDTFFGYLDKWNIKTTASKFMIGLFLIIVLIGVGGYVGTLAKSTIASGIGAFFGGVGGLYLVTSWGLFPLWVTFSITLISIAVISSMIRNIFTGNGGS